MINILSKVPELYTFLIIAALLAVFYGVVMIYHSSKFNPVTSRIPDIERKPEPVKIMYEPDLYKTQDTRIQNPFTPPVNPNARNSVVLDNVTSAQDLYSNQDPESRYYILDTPPAQNVNELVYSGGTNELLKIPLQYNDPYNEQLRSQDILITPYNKIKYGKCE